MKCVRVVIRFNGVVRSWDPRRRREEKRGEIEGRLRMGMRAREVMISSTVSPTEGRLQLLLSR